VILEEVFIVFYSSLGYQSFMLSLKSQISVLDNFVIREESISPVLAMINKEHIENSQIVSEGSLDDVSRTSLLLSPS
jgi:hypothetical protein